MAVIDPEPIAVVGIGCRFPGNVNSTKDFWEALKHGTNMIGQIPSDRFDSASFYHEDRRKYGAIRSDKGGFLDNIHGFDADFFGYYPAEASRMDPQQRLALEASVHALEDSGTPLNKVTGSRTSVFMGIFSYDHLSMQTAPEQRDSISPHTAMGVSACSTANRVSHRLNLNGPSLTLDTACSSSLAAVHLGCQSLRSGESETALVGGVNTILRAESSILMSQGGFLSSDGSCKPFDSAANGYVRSEGVGMVFLKPVSKALQDGDRIYACIRGSLANHDGYTPEGLTVPSPIAQGQLLKTVYKQSRVDPSQVRYVEAHGPGTPVGDPIEAKALGEHLGQARSHDREPLYVGSVKGSFGHLEGAAGIIGFIKAAMVTFHGQIPPQVNHNTPNPAIDFQSLRLAVPTKMITFTEEDKHKRFVGVNSFGAGGTNAHVILEEAPSNVGIPSLSSSKEPHVFVLSARSTSALEHSARDLASHLRHQQPALEDVAYTLNKRRSLHNRIAVMASNSSERLIDRLDQLGSRQPPKDTLTLQRRPGTRPKIAFLISGQGGQWLGMGMALAKENAVFAGSLATFDAIFIPLAGFSICAEIWNHGHGTSRLNKTTIAQPAITAIQIALARMLISYGVKPGAVVGHSVGEIAAAHIAGALTLEEAVTVIYLRSHIQSRVAGTGSMLATGLSSVEAKQLIERRQVDRRVEVAAHNGPEMTTLTGSVSELHQLAEELEKSGKFARLVSVDNPYHSRVMDSLKDALIEGLSPIRGKQSEIDIYSTVTTRVEPGTHLTGTYWFENIRKPVRYVETVTRMLEDGHDFLAEIGPHPVLVSGTRGIAQTAKQSINVLPAMTRGSDINPVLRLLGAAHALGGSVDLSSLHGGGRFVDLPLYPFQRENHWSEDPQVQQARLAKSPHPFLKSSTALTDDGRGTIQLQLSTGVSPFLADHVVDGAVVFPMTGYIESAFLAAKEHMPMCKKVWLEDIRFEHPMVLASAEDFAPQAQVEIVSPAKDYVVSTRSAFSAPTDAWQVCSRGRINAFDDPPKPDMEALDSITTRLQTGTEVDVEDFYRKLDTSGLRYGDAFRCIQRIYRLGSEVFSSVKLPPLFASEASLFKFHPSLLDACLHTLSAYVHQHGNPLQIYLPYHTEKIDILATGAVTAGFAHIQVNRHDDMCLRCDATVYGPDGKVLAIIQGMTAKRLQGKHQTGHTDYRISYYHDSKQDVEKVQAEFDHVLIVQPQDATSDWVKSTVQSTFPSAQVYRTGLESTATSWETAKWGFKLDRRTLLIIPALVSGPSHWDFHERLHAVIQTLVRIASWINEQQGGATLLVVTNGSCMTASDLQCHPVSSSIQAAALVMANELPKSRPRIIDLPVDQPQDHEMSLLQDELRTARLSRHESVVAIRPAGRFFRRIEPVDLEEEERQNQIVLPARGGKYQAEASSSGTFDDIVFRQQHSRVLGANEVGVEVHATGLNFKDVMNSMGLLSERATSGGLAGQKLGLEIAGRIVEVGDEVHNMKIGDPVMAQAASGFGGFAVVNQSLCVPIPSTVSFPQAASLPTAFVTAYYSLVYLGRLTAGESVLIHSAAGGVGMAAIQIAKLVGARVYATAGNPSRRAQVSEMGVDAVFDSRSLSIRDEITKATKGHGVDAVLNSLTGTMLSQSIACLAPFGRFLEIGKTDIYRNMRLGLEHFGQNRSLFVIDIDRLASQKPLLHRQMMVELYGLFEMGKLVPPEMKTHSITDLSTALSELSRSAIVGKAVIEMPQDHGVQASPPSRLQLRSDRSYLITGGTTGLGLHIARLLVERGAKYLVLLSRSGPKSPEDYAIISGLERCGVVVNIERADISSPEVATSLFREQTKWPPIAGVVHSAGVLDDAYSHNTTTDSFWKVFAPKSLGALNLHRATQDLDLDFFVLVSSISGVLGLNGQLSYAAANQFLDGLAHHRRASGLPGVSLNLGVLGDYAGMSGHSAHNYRVLQVLESQGFAPMSLPAVFSTVERAIIHGSTQRMAAIIDWSMFLKAHPHLILNGTFQGLDRDQAGGDGTDSNRTLAQLSGPERVDAISSTLRSGVAKILGVHVDRISDSENIDQYAFDSLTLTQIRSLILREFRVPYPMMKLFEGPSLKEIALEVDGSTGNTRDKGLNLESHGNSSTAPISSHGLTILSPWFVRGAPAKSPSPRLVCFHSMGASASLFAPFLLNPPDGLDVVAVQLPGRDTRADEPVERNLGKIVSGILSEIDQVVGTPHIFWGHSFGGIIALEVLRALRRQGRPLPRLLITGTIAPHLVERWQRRDLLIQVFQENYSPEYMMAVSRYVDDADFVRFMLPIMRQDAPLLLDYQYHEEEPLDLPITAFAARQDDMVYPDEVAAWQRHAKEFRLIEVDGDHWFLYRNRELIRETLTGMIE